MIRLLTSQSLIYLQKARMPSAFHQKTPIVHVFTAQAATVLVAFGLLAGLSACSKPQPVAEPVRAVKVLQVGASSVEAGHEYAGEVRARVESSLGFRVAGKITQRPAEVGQHVKAGQVLAQLDAQDYQLAAEGGRAQVRAAQTQRDLAAADFKRYQALKEQNFIGEAQLQRYETVLKAAQAQLDQAQVQLKGQGNQAGYSQLVAPASGVVTAVLAEPGQVVAAGTPVLRVAQDGARDVVFNVPEDRVRGLAVGSGVLVKRWAQTGDLTGKVREVAASADPSTRTFPVKVAVDAAQAPALGSTVYVYPQAGSAAPQVIKLPTSALFLQAQQTHVWVLDTQSMTVKSTLVQIATADGNDAIVSSGLQPGMMVVSAGVHVLSPNQKVTIYNQKSAGVHADTAQAATKDVADAASTVSAASAAKGE
jgi:membrane fusion protein, multidrug efflux system